MIKQQQQYQTKALKKKIRSVLLVYRTASKQAHSLATECAEFLKQKKIDVYSHPTQNLGERRPFFPKYKPSVRLDLVLVLGGDGTYLEALRSIAGAPIPFLGVNMGSLGFLTVNRQEDLIARLNAVFAGQMETRERSMLQIQIKKGGKQSRSFFALNDLVMERGAQSRLISLSIFVKDQIVSPIKADGLIVATPTGSTAYNLAAGGPILHPESRSFVVTPICPHSLTSRPTILPDDQMLSFRIFDPQLTATLTIDGKSCGQISHKDEVLVSRATHNHVVLREPKHNYFNLLREKLKFGERA